MKYKKNQIRLLNQHTAVIEIPAPDGRIHSYKFDADKIAQVEKYGWNTVRCFDGKYRAAAYKSEGKNIYLNRLVAGVRRKQQVISLNQDPFDCRAENLKKVANRQERQKELFACVLPKVKKFKNAHSYPVVGGVRWAGQFKHNGKHYHKGGFGSLKEAQAWVRREKAGFCGC